MKPLDYIVSLQFAVNVRKEGMLMLIKDVEKLTGMTRAYIRYYEKQCLLDQTTRNEYNYREYTEEDVLKLQRIKLLRKLEVNL